MFQSLRNPNFKLFWFGQMVSLPGSWMQTIGLSWLVLKISNRPDILGLVTLLQFLPILLFALVGGVVADRVPKRKFLLFTQSVATVQAFALGLLVSFGVINLWEIYVLSLIGGLNAAFDNPTRQAFVVEMVGREDVANAVALNSGLFNAARIVGPAIGGWIIANPHIGIAGTFYLNGVSYAAAIGALLAMNPRHFHATGAPPRGRMAAQVLEGWRYCFSLPATAIIIILMAVIGTFGYNFTVSLPLLAKYALGLGPKGFGYLTAAMGLGSLFGAAYLARIAVPTRRLLLTGLGAFTIILGLISLSGNFYLTFGLLVALGFAGLLGTATGNTLLQIDTPDELRGRVMSIYFLLLAGSTPIGGYLTGILARYYQIRPTLSMESAVCLIGIVWSVYYYRSRKLYIKDRQASRTRVGGRRLGSGATTTAPPDSTRRAADDPSLAPLPEKVAALGKPLDPEEQTQAGELNELKNRDERKEMPESIGE
ncbi:MAG TPA: MFS transporter [Armatimonadota bacterium]|nr:MFS transporter [Armatimonadota bacterium]